MSPNVMRSNCRNLSTFRRFDVSTFLLAFAAFIASSQAYAAQHLVTPGDSWSELALRVRPGDEIILMPGRHQPASFDDLQGTHDQPITIRGLTIKQPSIIQARQHGIRLRRPKHIVIRDLAITGATVAGVQIMGDPSNGEEEGSAAPQPNATPPLVPPPPLGQSPAHYETPWPAHVAIRNITIERTGPRGRRNAIHLEGVRHIIIERVLIDGWGGSAVKIIASSNVRLEHSIARGRDDHGQLSGVQIRGGSENIRISRCLFTDAGEAAIVLGEAESAPRNPPAGDEPAHEARRVTLERNVFRRGESAFAFLSAEQCVARNNTIINSKRFAYFIAPPGNLRQVTFGSNIIVWKPGAMEALAYLQPPAKGDGLIVEQNLWWSDEPADAPGKLAQPVGDVRSPQMMDVDPDLDEQFKPRNRRAQMFGTEGP